MTPDPDLETEPEPEAADVVVAVTVVRSGGFAGLTRRWGVQAPPADAEQWLALVEDCPWDDRDDGDARDGGDDEHDQGEAPDRAAGPRAGDAPRARGADRFSWSVQARLSGASHRVDLTESQASGPWRTLIDAVRAADG